MLVDFLWERIMTEKIGCFFLFSLFGLFVMTILAVVRLYAVSHLKIKEIIIWCAICFVGFEIFIAYKIFTGKI